MSKHITETGGKTVEGEEKDQDHMEKKGGIGFQHGKRKIGAWMIGYQIIDFIINNIWFNLKIRYESGIWCEWQNV